MGWLERCTGGVNPGRIRDESLHFLLNQEEQHRNPLERFKDTTKGQY